MIASNYWISGLCALPSGFLCCLALLSFSHSFFRPGRPDPLERGLSPLCCPSKEHIFWFLSALSPRCPWRKFSVELDQKGSSLAPFTIFKFPLIHPSAFLLIALLVRSQSVYRWPFSLSLSLLLALILPRITLHSSISLSETISLVSQDAVSLYQSLRV